MTPFEMLAISTAVVVTMSIGLIVCWKVITSIDEKIERDNKLMRERTHNALAAIRNARTLEEKIFRSDPDNDEKPFIPKKN